MSGVSLSHGETLISRVVAAVRALAAGRNNATGTATLAAGVTTTTVAAPNCGPDSQVFLFPRTANAAVEVGNGTIYILAANVTAAQFVITHANGVSLDRTFSYVCLG